MEIDLDWQKPYLEIMHHEDRVGRKEGFLIAHGSPGGFWPDMLTTADYEPQDFHPDFAEWPKSLWGYFPTKEAAKDAVEAAGLMHMLEKSSQ